MARGMAKGIGPVYAMKLVEDVGEKSFDLIEQEPARLEDVDGIGPKRRQRIKAVWAEQKVIRTIMVFLHRSGGSSSRALLITSTVSARPPQPHPPRALPLCHGKAAPNVIPNI